MTAEETDLRQSKAQVPVEDTAPAQDYVHVYCRAWQR
jgi:hypothetical protein